MSLDTHIEDMLAVLEYEDLQDVVLAGPGYGGTVASGVADRAAALRRSRSAWTRSYRATARARSTCLFPLAGRARSQAHASDQRRAGWCRRTRCRLFAERTRADAAWRLWGSTPTTTPQPHITMPLTLAALLHRIAANRARPRVAALGKTPRLRCPLYAWWAQLRQP